MPNFEQRENLALLSTEPKKIYLPQKSRQQEIKKMAESGNKKVSELAAKFGKTVSPRPPVSKPPPELLAKAKNKATKEETKKSSAPPPPPMPKVESPAPMGTAPKEETKKSSAPPPPPMPKVESPAPMGKAPKKENGQKKTPPPPPPMPKPKATPQKQDDNASSDGAVRPPPMPVMELEAQLEEKTPEVAVPPPMAAVLNPRPQLEEIGVVERAQEMPAGAKSSPAAPPIQKSWLVLRIGRPWVARDKNREVSVSVGDEVFVLREESEWVYGETSSGSKGWFPAACAEGKMEFIDASIDENVITTTTKKKSLKSEAKALVAREKELYTRLDTAYLACGKPFLNADTEIKRQVLGAKPAVMRLLGSLKTIADLCQQTHNDLDLALQKYTNDIELRTHLEASLQRVAAAAPRRYGGYAACHAEAAAALTSAEGIDAIEQVLMESAIIFRGKNDQASMNALRLCEEEGAHGFISTLAAPLGRCREYGVFAETANLNEITCKAIADTVAPIEKALASAPRQAKLLQLTARFPKSETLFAPDRYVVHPGLSVQKVLKKKATKSSRLLILLSDLLIIAKPRFKQHAISDDTMPLLIRLLVPLHEIKVISKRNDYIFSLLFSTSKNPTTTDRPDEEDHLTHQAKARNNSQDKDTEASKSHQLSFAALEPSTRDAWLSLLSKQMDSARNELSTRSNIALKKANQTKSKDKRRASSLWSRVQPPSTNNASSSTASSRTRGSIFRRQPRRSKSPVPDSTTNDKETRPLPQVTTTSPPPAAKQKRETPLVQPKKITANTQQQSLTPIPQVVSKPPASAPPPPMTIEAAPNTLKHDANPPAPPPPMPTSSNTSEQETDFTSPPISAPPSPPQFEQQTDDDPAPPPPPLPSGGLPMANNADLMSALRGNRQLKHVSVRVSRKSLKHALQKSSGDNSTGGGTLAMLAKALDERRFKIQDNEEDDDDDDDDDDWSSDDDDFDD